MKTSRIIRLIISAYFLVFVSCFGYAQMGIKWQKHIGGTGIDESPNIQKTPDGNLLLVFGSKSRDYDCVGNHGGTDVFLMKLDVQGNKIWTKFYGGSSNDEYPDAVIDQAGNIYVCSTTFSEDGDLLPDKRGLADRWLFKTDPDGKLIWQKRIGGTSRDEGQWVKIKSNGNILTGGKTFSKDFDIPVNYGDSDNWIVEFSPEGEIVHNSVFGNIYTQQDYNGLTTADDGFLLASVSSGVEGMVQGSSHGLDDIWLAKIDKDYNIEWQGLYGGENEDRFVRDILQIEDGYVMITKSQSVNGQMMDGSCMGEDIFRDLWLFKVDLLGDFKWGRCIGLPDIKEEPSLFQTWNFPADFKSIFQMEDGGFMVFASSPNPRCVAGLQLPTNPSGLSVTRTDSLGYIIWQQVLGDRQDVYTDGVVNIGKGRWIVASQAALNALCDATVKSYGNFDIWLIELRECEYYKTSRPEGDTRVCINLQPTSEYVTHPYFDANGYLWVIDPAEAGVASNTDSITTITWNPNFEGTAKLSVRLDTECGIIQPSDTLEVEVHRDCIGVEDLAMQRIKLFFQPNPANESSVLHYTLPASENKARLELYDLSGQMVYSAELRQHEGMHIIPTGNLKGGVYMCSIVSGHEKGVGRLVVVK
jgi:hypothetical protein